MRRFLDAMILLLYSTEMYFLWRLCQYGRTKHYLELMIFGAVLLSGLFIVKLVLWKKGYRAPYAKIRMVVFGVVTAFFGALIIDSAIPYHGQLSWKIEELRSHRSVEFTHCNIFVDGIGGILQDMGRRISLPEELYVSNDFSVRFKKDGTITRVETMLLGKDKKGEGKTFLISYDGKHGNRMDVWVGKDPTEYDEDRALQPLSVILSNADMKDVVETWSKQYGDTLFGILYYGKRNFQTAEGLCLVSDISAQDEADVNGSAGDKADMGRNAQDGTYSENSAPGSALSISRYESAIRMLAGGGEVRGYEMSLYLPEDDTVTPVRYIMEPVYISQSTLDAEHEDEMVTEAKTAEGWTVDREDGSVYTFVKDDGNIGFRLVVLDAAAGSRFYGLEKTTDAGKHWERINEDPFLGETGVAEGIEFFTEDSGVIRLDSPSGDDLRSFMTTDGGLSFTKVTQPPEQLDEVPEEGRSGADSTEGQN